MQSLQNRYQKNLSSICFQFLSFLKNTYFLINFRLLIQLKKCLILLNFLKNHLVQTLILSSKIVFLYWNYNHYLTFLLKVFLLPLQEYMPQFNLLTLLNVNFLNVYFSQLKFPKILLIFLNNFPKFVLTQFFYSHQHTLKVFNLLI